MRPQRLRDAHQQHRHLAAGHAAGRPHGRHRPAPHGVRLLRGLLGVVAVLALATLAWIAAYYVTGWGYARLGAHPAELLRQVITAAAGLLFLVLPVGTFSAIRQPRELAAWRSILAALGRIAQGDFHVRVQSPGTGHQHPYSQLVNSINDMAEGLDRTERLRQEFVSNVSHEIQSPLTSIRGFARALREDGLSEQERTRALAIIETESERLGRLSDNLLKLTTLDAQALQPVAYALDRQLRGVILAAEPQWSGKGLAVEAELEPVAIAADASLLEHVWVNLIHNAIKFTPTGGLVTVRLKASGHGVAVEVADTGIGIAPDDQPRIFERFFKADRARDRATDGSGLGLALAKRIVEIHGGQVRVDSRPGEGATFRVELPLQQPTARRGTTG